MKPSSYLTVPALLACLALPAQAVTVAGIDYPPQVAVASQTLQLNGAGLRYKFVVKVYTAGLYLPTQADTPEQVMAETGPKRLHVVMWRDIDGNELGRLFTRGMQDN
ncbi:MAG: chalcone isomerase family protein, partial [Rubrivivax sp.]|nr:chalcone isomerase family protein [Rubrivivax sp.]